MLNRPMQDPKPLILRLYNNIFEYIAEPRLKAKDLNPLSMHIALSIVLSTSLIMWGYCLVSFFSISSSVPWIVGAFASLIHLLSPLLFRYTNCVTLVGNILISMGFIHEMVFSYYTGGFMARALIWLGILPLIGGLIDGKKGVKTWALTSLFGALSMLSLHLYHYDFPDLINSQGRLAAQCLIIFGWILISSIIIFVYVKIKDETETMLANQSKKIDDLVKVLFHDLANPLGRIALGLNISKDNATPEKAKRGIDIATRATNAMIEITHSVREMYAISKGNADIQLKSFSLIEAIEYVKKVCEGELEDKRIQILYSPEEMLNLNVMVEPVSFKNQVLTNIISNSIKFSQPHKDIRIFVTEQDKQYVEVKIKDQGIGMPPQLLGDLFDLTKKTSRSGTNGEQGTGFGLHIMKSFIEMYGGSVSVESNDQEGESGSTFTLKLKKSEDTKGPETGPLETSAI